MGTSIVLTFMSVIMIDPLPIHRPNIVFILADDLGWGDLRSNNPASKIDTPVLDRLARDGIRFTDAHSDSAVCTPTRYGIMTGRHSWRSRLKRGVLGGLSPALIESDRPTLASFLREQGYRTACVGKWHLGMNWAIHPGKTISSLGIELQSQVDNVDYTQKISHGPTKLGFDSFFGIAASLDMVPYTYIVDDHVLVPPTATREFPMIHGGANPAKTRRGPGAPDFSDDKVLPDFISHAVAFIEESTRSNDAKPFFLYLPLAAPHTPIAPTEAYRGASGLTPYADFLMQTDAGIGEVIAAIEQSGQKENTLIIVSSDNGFAPLAGFDELVAKGHRPSGPFRGHKADLYEGGHRVPLIVRWPTAIKAGQVSTSLVCLNDLFATLAEIVQAPLPAGGAEDSVSFAALFVDPTQPCREELVSLSQNGSLALRQGDWKYLECPGSGGWSYPRPGVDRTDSLAPVQLFDLRADPAESKNRALDHPEIVQRLARRLSEIRAGRPDTLQPK
jgi:arylsulfatase A